MKITKEEVEHVALLGRLELTGEEKENFTKQLNDILLHFERLNELDTEGVEPTSHVLPMQNVFREDDLGEAVNRDEVLKEAPDEADGCFKVPRVVE